MQNIKVFFKFLLVFLHRFTSSDSKPLSETEFTDVKKTSETVVSETPKEVQKVIRTKVVWVPCQLLCYKMNMEASVG